MSSQKIELADFLGIKVIKLPKKVMFSKLPKNTSTFILNIKKT